MCHSLGKAGICCTSAIVLTHGLCLHMIAIRSMPRRHNLHYMAMTAIRAVWQGNMDTGAVKALGQLRQ